MLGHLLSFAKPQDLVILKFRHATHLLHYLYRICSGTLIYMKGCFFLGFAGHVNIEQRVEAW